MGCTRGVSLLAAGFKEAQPLAFIVVLVWLLCGHKLHQFVTLDEGQRPRTAAPQLCTFCKHAVLANLVNPIKLGGSRGGWSHYYMHGTAPITQYMAASTQFNPLSQQVIIYIPRCTNVIRNVRSIIIPTSSGVVQPD